MAGDFSKINFKGLDIMVIFFRTDYNGLARYTVCKSEEQAKQLVKKWLEVCESTQPFYEFIDLLESNEEPDGQST